LTHNEQRDFVYNFFKEHPQLKTAWEVLDEFLCQQCATCDNLEAGYSSDELFDVEGGQAIGVYYNTVSDTACSVFFEDQFTPDPEFYRDPNVVYVGDFVVNDTNDFEFAAALYLTIQEPRPRIMPAGLSSFADSGVVKPVGFDETLEDELACIEPEFNAEAVVDAGDYMTSGRRTWLFSEATMSEGGESLFVCDIFLNVGTNLLWGNAHLKNKPADTYSDPNIVRLGSLDHYMSAAEFEDWVVRQEIEKGLAAPGRGVE